MDLSLSSKGWVAFTLIFGFIIVFTWIINLLKITLFDKIFFTIGGAILTFIIVKAKNI